MKKKSRPISNIRFSNKNKKKKNKKLMFDIGLELARKRGMKKIRNRFQLA